MRKEPKALDFDEFADELLRERQPRALVILAVAKIDTQLRDLIEKFLLTKSAKPNEADELLDRLARLAASAPILFRTLSHHPEWLDLLVSEEIMDPAPKPVTKLATELSDRLPTKGQPP